MKYEPVCEVDRPIYKYNSKGECLGVSSSIKGRSLPSPPSGREWSMQWMTYVGGDLMNPGIRILLLPSTDDPLGKQMGG